MNSLKAALEYSAKGWLVFPLHGIVEGQCTCRVKDCPDAGKHPITRQGVKDASKDPEVIRLWFSGNENIAIATGEISGLTVLDIDIGEKCGDVTWSELTKEKGEPQTLMSRTGSGGIHVLFRYNSVLKTSSNTLGKGVDCRNDGGYIVAPPSKHRSGNDYAWINEYEIQVLPNHLTSKPERQKKKKKKKKHYTIDEVRTMLDVIPAEDRDLWRNVGLILGREFDRSDEAWDLYNTWSDKWGGTKGRNHDMIMREAFYELSSQEGEMSLGTIIKVALEAGWAPKTGTVPLDNFLYFAPGNNYIYKPTLEFWIASSVDSSCSPVNDKGNITKASDWLRANALITSMTSDPSIEEIRKEWDCLGGNLVPSKGGALFNSYRAPFITLGDPELASPWLDHVHRVFPLEDDADQFINYMAHRVQFPGVKPRFSLVLVGEQGVGKDTAIQMCGPAIGEWNVESIDPKVIESGFNEHCAKVLVVVSEAANAQDMSKWSFNEKMKVLIAGTPDYMTVNPKYGHKFSVRMHCGVIITTNHLSGLYIPPDDRRYDVIQTPTRDEMFRNEDRGKYFGSFWKWFSSGGANHIAAFLHARDLSGFDASIGQRITDAHRQIVSSGYDGDQWLTDALDKLKNPPVVTFNQIWDAVQIEEGVNLKEFKARIGHVMPRVGFTRLVNPISKDGRWKISSVWTNVFYDMKKIDRVKAIETAKHANGELKGKW